MFACHKTAQGREVACAGWLAIEGVNHPAVRIAVLQERLDPDTLTPAPGWPELYTSFAEMAEANGAGPATPATCRELTAQPESGAARS